MVRGSTDDDSTEKRDVHADIHAYQYEFLKSQNFVIAGVIRDALDDWMVQQGADPDRHRRTRPHEDDV